MNLMILATTKERNFMEQVIINSGKLAIPDLIKLAEYSKDQLFIDYDKEADVLYISFGKPQKADDSIHGENDIIRRKKAGKVIGLTILNASRFNKSKNS